MMRAVGGRPENRRAFAWPARGPHNGKVLGLIVEGLKGPRTGDVVASGPYTEWPPGVPLPGWSPPVPDDGGESVDDDPPLPDQTKPAVDPDRGSPPGGDDRG